jgi:transposase InsO family protein
MGDTFLAWWGLGKEVPMPWKEVSVMSARREFVTLALTPGANVRELCHRFAISPKTGHKWIARFIAEGKEGLADRSRRPHRSPRRTPDQVEACVVALRRRHPAWGGRKLRRRLGDLGHCRVPSASTITEILRRHGLIDPAESQGRQPWCRFEHEAPNDLWQMDFKGHFALGRGGRCHPLTVLDDHSRYCLGLRACGDERRQTVIDHLGDIFTHHGLPERMLMDNGAPWGMDAEHPFTRLGMWLIRLGVGVCHGRPFHPQTQGKDERFHRTLKAEALRGPPPADLPRCQHHFDQWREVYNLERPHEALALAVPASRYRPSARPMPRSLPPIEYGPGDAVRRVQDGGKLSYHGRHWRVGRAFIGQPVAVRPSADEGVVDVFFCHQRIARIDLRGPGQCASAPPPGGRGRAENGL